MSLSQPLLGILRLQLPGFPLVMTDRKSGKSHLGINTIPIPINKNTDMQSNFPSFCLCVHMQKIIIIKNSPISLLLFIFAIHLFDFYNQKNPIVTEVQSLYCVSMTLFWLSGPISSPNTVRYNF